MSQNSRKPRRKPQPELAVEQPVESIGMPVWKKFLISAAAVGTIMAIVFLLQTQPANADESVVSDVPVEVTAPAPAEEKGFFQKWIDKKVASTNDDIAEKLRALDAREQELNDREKILAAEENSSESTRNQIMAAANALHECAIAAVKEVSPNVAETPES